MQIMEIKNSNQDGMETPMSGGFAQRGNIQNKSSDDITMEDEDVNTDEEVTNDEDETDDLNMESEEGEVVDLEDYSDASVDEEQSDDDNEEDDIQEDDMEDDDTEDVDENAFDRK
jgi:hypothetical protein